MNAEVLRSVADGVTMIDTAMAGQRELNAVYVLASREPTLIEAAPEADGAVVNSALRRLGIGPGDLAHIVLTHVHMDHAGGAGELLQHFPRARVWIHERGASHLVDPTKLIASTERTYGRDRRVRLFGDMTPCDASRVQPLRDGDAIDLGDRTLQVIATPGHASHHVAIFDGSSGAMWTGEAIGSFLPWAPVYRPALPPPEVDLEAFHASIEAMRAGHPSTLLTSHFGPTPGVEAAFEAAAVTTERWAEAVRRVLDADPDASLADAEDALRALAADELRTNMADLEAVIDRYDALGSIAMNAAGLTRYWRKRWEAQTS